MKALPLVLLLLPGLAAAQDVPATPTLPTQDPSPPPVTEPAPAPSPAAPKISWKDGRTRAEFEHALITLTNRVQFRFTEQLPDDATRLAGTDAAGQGVGSFRLRRVKTKLEGWIYSPRMTYEMQLNWAELGSTPGNTVEDLTLAWDVTGRKLLFVRIGQFKVPFGRQVITSSMGQQFVDRAVVANEFAKGRDQGLELHGLIARERLEWRLGVFNGNGQTRTTNDNRRYQYDARLAWMPFGDPKFSEVDFESADKPLVALAASFEDNDTHGATTGVDVARRVFGVDGVLKYRGWFVTSEVYRRTLEPEGAGDFRSDGWFAQAGKLFLDRHLEVAARHGRWDPSALVPADTRKESAAAVSWYEHRHALKVQSEFRWVTDDAKDTTDRELRIQAQFAF